jgi:transcriptional regulator with XRE-family HTH domain
MTVMATDRHRDPDRLLRAGEWLRETRTRRGLTAAELAELIDTSPQNISNYERGMATVNDDRAAKIATALGLDIITTRQGLGLWVPDDTPGTPASTPNTLSAIQQDRDLIPEARRHLLNQYKLLRRLGPVPASEAEVDASLDAIAKATQEVVEKKKPRRKPGE